MRKNFRLRNLLLLALVLNAAQAAFFVLADAVKDHYRRERGDWAADFPLPDIKRLGETKGNDFSPLSSATIQEIKRRNYPKGPDICDAVKSKIPGSFKNFNESVNEIEKVTSKIGAIFVEEYPIGDARVAYYFKKRDEKKESTTDLNAIADEISNRSNKGAFSEDYSQSIKKYGISLWQRKDIISLKDGVLRYDMLWSPQPIQDLQKFSSMPNINQPPKFIKDVLAKYGFDQFIRSERWDRFELQYAYQMGGFISRFFWTKNSYDFDFSLLAKRNNDQSVAEIRVEEISCFYREPNIENTYTVFPPELTFKKPQFPAYNRWWDPKQ